MEIEHMKTKSVNNSNRNIIAFLLMVVPFSAQPQEADTIVLEEVTVTAQKRAESLQDVPISITALTATDITNQRLRDAAEITAHIPNLLATNPSGDGFPIFSLRGISMSDFSFDQSSPLATCVDEVCKSNPAPLGLPVRNRSRQTPRCCAAESTADSCVVARPVIQPRT